MTLSIPQRCSSWPSSNPAGPAPMMATLVRTPCPLEHCRLECSGGGIGRVLAMIIIVDNNNCKGPSKPALMRGDDVDEDRIVGVAAGRRRDARFDARFDPGAGAGKDLRAEAVALGAGVASVA